MRGIAIHSLMARGVSFDDANEAANQARERLRGRGVVSKADILKEFREFLGDAPFEAEHHVPLPADITVTGEGGRTQPFSKGLLSQSLQAAAIDPNDAFDVARELEHRMIREGTRRIERAVDL